MDKPTCKTCGFYSAFKPGWHEDDKGHCVRHAPRPYVRAASYNHFQGYDSGPSFVVPVRPTVRESFGCGEHPDFAKYIKSLEATDD